MVYDHYKYGNHSVVAVGYSEFTYFGWYQNSYSTYIRIADGWTDYLQQMTIMSGSNGNIVEVPDSGDWEKIVKSLDHLEFELMKKTERRTGWGYRLYIKTAEKELDFVFSGPRCYTENKTYQISKEKKLTETEDLLDEIFLRLAE